MGLCNRVLLEGVVPWAAIENIQGVDLYIKVNTMGRGETWRKQTRALQCVMHATDLIHKT